MPPPSTSTTSKWKLSIPTLFSASNDPAHPPLPIPPPSHPQSERQTASRPRPFSLISLPPTSKSHPNSQTRGLYSSLRFGGGDTLNESSIPETREMQGGDMPFMSGGLLERGEGGRREVIENPFLDPVEMDTGYNGGGGMLGDSHTGHMSLSSPMRYEIDSGFGRNHKHKSSLSTYSEIPIAELEAEPISNTGTASSTGEGGGEHLDIIAAKMALRASLLKVTERADPFWGIAMEDKSRGMGASNEFYRKEMEKRRRKRRVMDWLRGVSRTSWVLIVVGLVAIALVVLAIFLFVG